MNASISTMNPKKWLIVAAGTIAVLAVMILFPLLLLQWAPTMSPNVKAVVHVLIRPLPWIYALVICGWFLHLGATIAKIERRSYWRAIGVVLISAGVGAIIEAVSKFYSWRWWIEFPLYHLAFGLSIPIVYRTTIGKSLVAFLVATVLTMATIGILGLLLMQLGIWPK